MTQQIKQRIEQIKNGIVPQGYKNTKVGIVPSDWEEKTLGNLLSFKNGINADKERFGKGTKLISVMDILSSRSIDYEMIQSSIDVNEKEIDNYNVTYGDILFQRSSETFDDAGKSNVYLDKNNVAVYSGFVIRGKKIAEYNPYYLNQLLKHDKVRKQIIGYAAGSQHVNIGQKSLEKVEVCLASNAEQARIAEILSTQDRLIELQEKLINQKQQQKKYLMQVLLTQKNEWVKTPLRKILIERKEKTTENNQYAAISSTKFGLRLQSDYFDKQVASENNIGYKIIRLEQIVLSPQNLWLGNINFNDKFEIGIVSPSYKVFEIIDVYNKNFIAHMMKTSRMLHNYILSSEQGASIVRRNLDMELFCDIVISIPNREQQNKIANILLKADEEIELLQKQLAQLKLKQKAMQQLLLTGIVRV